MVLNNKIRRTMLENKSLYFGSFALIVISCLLYTMLNLLLVNLEGTKASFESKYVQEDASFVTDKKLTRIPELEAQFNVSLEEGGSFDYAPGQGNTLRIFAKTRKVNRYAVIEGSRLSGGDLLLDPAYAKANHIQIGDSLSVGGKAFKVSGSMSLPNYIYPLQSDGDIVNDPAHFGIAVMSRSDFDLLHKGGSFYSVKVRGNTEAADRGSVQSVLAAFREEVRKQNVLIVRWTSTEDNLRVTFVNAKIASMKQMSSSLPVAILLLTCILTGIVLWRMLRREFVIVGTLYALGYRRSEIVRHYLKYPFAIAVAGGVAGTLLGALAFRPMLAFMLTYFNMPLDTASFLGGHLAISVLLPVVFLGISGYFVIRKALRRSPVELMRGGGEERRIGFLERRVKLDGLKFTTKFKIRDQLRSIPRSVFLLLGVALATMLLLLGFTMKSSIDFLLKQSFDQAYKYKYQYMYRALQQGKPAQGEAFSELLFTLKSDAKQGITVFGVSPSTRYLSFKDMKGNPLSMNQVVVTKALADKLHLKDKDTIEVIGKLDSKPYTFVIDSIADTHVGAYLYMPLSLLNEKVGFPADSYFGLWSEAPIRIPDSQLLSTTTTDEIKQALDSMLKPLQASMGTIAFLSFLIGLIVIYVVTSLIIEENKDNIALMKVLGYRNKEMYALILGGSSWMVVAGYVLGVPLLRLSLGALYQSATSSMNLTLPVTMDYRYVIIGFVIIYLTYELSKLLNKKKLARIPMTEALKSRAE
ncbi:ABC transporter permease [Paenibacillus cremeus]|uniref:FtsX-like permease family protein n=1 Tax=Paenibacillus cremeus TaxID=2163881 RepID=A0A559KBI3_9BACL|nr:FtsX-like permease family protein [Paenibacillus cremeus]TVY09481.1 FtsX-like permease family protein [Paenibacillus cremeus]